MEIGKDMHQFTHFWYLDMGIRILRSGQKYHVYEFLVKRLLQGFMVNFSLEVRRCILENRHFLIWNSKRLNLNLGVMFHLEYS